MGALGIGFGVLAFAILVMIALFLTGAIAWDSGDKQSDDEPQVGPHGEVE